MSYMTAQGKLKTLLLTNSNFSAGDVTEGDLRVLDVGRDNLAVLFPGSVPEYNLASMRRSRAWEGVIELYKRFSDDTTYSNFGTLRDSVFLTIEESNCLDETYFITSILAEGDVVEITDTSGGGPYYVMQMIRVIIEEQI
jgi:hypothetical protein